jgi:hypothetical protein
MVDLDAIKASGRNATERSAELMRMYVWSQRVKLHGELCRQAVAAGAACNGSGDALWAHSCERVPMPGWVAA